MIIVFPSSYLLYIRVEQNRKLTEQRKAGVIPQVTVANI